MHKLTYYQVNELEPSITTQLDVVGMQPHAREYLDYQINCASSMRQLEVVEDFMIDHCEGIQFSGRP